MNILVQVRPHDVNFNELFEWAMLVTGLIYLATAQGYHWSYRHKTGELRFITM